MMDTDWLPGQLHGRHHRTRWRGRPIQVEAYPPVGSDQLVAGHPAFKVFHVLKSVESRSLDDCCTFQTYDDIVAACRGEIPKKMSQLADGSYLIQAGSARQCQFLGAITSIGGCQVVCKPHAKLNQSQGTIYCSRLMK